jgi:hypothetical protein
MAAAAPVAVCCPNCWKWTELKSSAACKRCGAPLVLPDGRRVDEARAGTAPAPVAYNAPTVSLAPLTVGTDWVTIARWITVAHGALTVLGIFAVGILLPTITVPVQDPNTGQIIDQTVNLRPILTFAAFFVIAIYALIVWLTKYGIARGIMLVLVALVALLTLGRMSTENSSAVAVSIFYLLCDAGYAFVLIMTFARPLRPAPLHPGTTAPAPLAVAPPPPPPLPPPLP